jgi:hypothetical protein
MTVLYWIGLNQTIVENWILFAQQMWDDPNSKQTITHMCAGKLAALRDQIVLRYPCAWQYIFVLTKKVPAIKLTNHQSFRKQ